MVDSKKLRQERAAVVEQMREMNERAEAEGQTLDAEAFDRLETEFRGLGERIERTEKIEARATEMGEIIPSADPAVPGAADPEAGGERAQRKAAFFQYMRHGKQGLSSEQRALVEDSDGQILVPEDLDSEILKATEKESVIRGIAGKRNTTRDRVKRRSLNGLVVGWGKLETGGTLAEGSFNPDQATAYVEDLNGLTKIGIDELDDSDVALEVAVRDAFAEGIAEEEDTAFITGTGHGDEMPEGVLMGSTVTRVDALQANAVTFDDLKKLVYAVPAIFRKNGKFVMASATELAFALLREDEDGGAYLWQPSLIEGRPNTILGYGAYNQEDVPAIPDTGYSDDVVIFGDWQKGYQILDRQGMTIQKLVELYAEDGLVGFLARFRVGGYVRKPDALRILSVPAS